MQSTYQARNQVFRLLTTMGNGKLGLMENGFTARDPTLLALSFRQFLE